MARCDVHEGGSLQFARNAVVAGVTGRVGTELLKLLDQERRYVRITSLVRQETVAAGRVENRVVSFDDLDRSELPEVDDAYCCLGTTRRVAGSDDAFRKVDFDYVLALCACSAPRWCSPFSYRVRHGRESGIEVLVHARQGSGRSGGKYARLSSGRHCAALVLNRASR